MKVCVILSCMHQTDHSIVERSNVQCDCVVVNQCDINKTEEYEYVNNKGEKRLVRFISTTERGLSRSRNMAIDNAPEDAICMVCDDDELIEDDAEEKILKAYESIPSCSVATFSLIRKDTSRKYPENVYQIGFRKALKVSSHQITFKRSFIVKAGIRFDEKMGSGTGNGGGEENKFILDCLRNKLKVYYFPNTIATILPSDSKWFSGYDKKFLYNNGWASRHMMGTFLGFAYVCYSIIHMQSRYKEHNVTPWQAFRTLLSGFFSKR